MMKYFSRKRPVLHTIEITNNELEAIIANTVRLERGDLDVPMLPTVKVHFRIDVAGNMGAVLTWETNE